jgi:hypothetical protein
MPPHTKTPHMTKLTALTVPKNKKLPELVCTHEFRTTIGGVSRDVQTALNKAVSGRVNPNKWKNGKLVSALKDKKVERALIEATHTMYRHKQIIILADLYTDGTWRNLRIAQ